MIAGIGMKPQSLLAKSVSWSACNRATVWVTAWLALMLVASMIASSLLAAWSSNEPCQQLPSRDEIRIRAARLQVHGQSIGTVSCRLAWAFGREDWVTQTDENGDIWVTLDQIGPHLLELRDVPGYALARRWILLEPARHGAGADVDVPSIAATPPLAVFTLTCVDFEGSPIQGARGDVFAASSDSPGKRARWRFLGTTQRSNISGEIEYAVFTDSPQTLEIAWRADGGLVAPPTVLNLNEPKKLRSVQVHFRTGGEVTLGLDDRLRPLEHCLIGTLSPAVADGRRTATGSFDKSGVATVKGLDSGVYRMELRLKGRNEMLPCVAPMRVDVRAGESVHVDVTGTEIVHARCIAKGIVRASTRGPLPPAVTLSLLLSSMSVIRTTTNDEGEFEVWSADGEEVVRRIRPDVGVMEALCEPSEIEIDEEGAPVEFRCYSSEPNKVVVFRVESKSVSQADLASAGILVARRASPESVLDEHEVLGCREGMFVAPLEDVDKLYWRAVVPDCRDEVGVLDIASHRDQVIVVNVNLKPGFERHLMIRPCGGGKLPKQIHVDVQPDVNIVIGQNGEVKLSGPHWPDTITIVAAGFEPQIIRGDEFGSCVDGTIWLTAASD